MSATRGGSGGFIQSFIANTVSINIQLDI
ncbi:hypothetical protein DERF_004617 [Dermatophagoides farinae]|uniref:Uncharacterized protein n=1 Tax=Dermatophagoides farinae TaxID=6954 RepID=A0A922I2B0_DERFA|nr:hypothetical protein DERF_004617 [Dermatophagoides farinae]